MVVPSGKMLGHIPPPVLFREGLPGLVDQIDFGFTQRVPQKRAQQSPPFKELLEKLVWDVTQEVLGGVLAAHRNIAPDNIMSLSSRRGKGEVTRDSTCVRRTL
jgi:hypothetical protein